MPPEFLNQDFHLVNVPYEKVTEEQLSAVWRLLTQECFNDLVATELEEDFTASPVSLVLCSLDMALVGCAGTFLREITYEGDKILLGGIGGVCTRADMRGRGVATSVCRIALEFLTAADCQVAFLATSPMARKIYEKLGFQALVQGFSWENVHGVIKFGNDGMVAPISSSEMAAKIWQAQSPFHVGLGYW